MNAQKYLAALQMTTDAAMKSGMSLPEIVGCLHLMAIQVERKAFHDAQITNARAVIEPPPGDRQPLNGN